MKPLKSPLSQLTLFAFLLVIALASRADPLLTHTLRIRNHEIRAEVANTEESRRRGLMFRDKLGENSGMVFIYPQADVSAMWMKNTHVPLSVAFIDRKGRILNIEDMEPLSENSHASAGLAAYALEVNRGWFKKRGIGVGDRVDGLKRLPPPQ